MPIMLNPHPCPTWGWWSLTMIGALWHHPHFIRRTPSFTSPGVGKSAIPDKKEPDVTSHQAPPIESVAAYQDPATTDHIQYETTPTGDLYAIPDKKEAGSQAPPIEPAGLATQYETIPTDDLYAIPGKKEANPVPPIEPVDSATQYETIPTDDLYAIPDNKEADIDASYPAPTEPAIYLVPATTQHEASSLPKLVYFTHHMYMYRLLCVHGRR